MNRIYLGEFEEMILLTVGILNDKAYGVLIMEELEIQSHRKAKLSAIHAVLKRLQKKGLVTSVMGGATTERGGRRKRMFTLTISGKAILDQVREVRDQMHDQIPQLIFDNV